MGGRGRSGASQEGGTGLCEVQGCYQVMLGLSHVYGMVKDVVKEVNSKAYVVPAEGCSFPAPLLYLLFLFQLIYKTYLVFNLWFVWVGFFSPFTLQIKSSSRVEEDL